MSFGFYGRSFQLADTRCTTPGCRFRGGADPGPCSDTSGILMYYEIMALLKQNPGLKPIYDKAAGVKYLVYNKDQWVSYDDAETFKQKVDWANNLGLGGSLIWASDAGECHRPCYIPNCSHFLDDDKYSAHSGLVGRSIKHPDVSVKAKRFSADSAAVTSNLIRQNGQACRKADKCIVDGGYKSASDYPANACESSEVQMGWAKERCGKGKSRAICCSRQTDKNSCRWRGGTGKADQCNGQCHSGEVMTLQSSWGGFPREKGTDTKQCHHGAKAYCCDAPDWEKIADVCRWTELYVS
jgi:chitinase